MSRRDLDDETIRVLFSRAYAETGDLAAAFRIVDRANRKRSTTDVDAVALNALIAEAARAHGVTPADILGPSRKHVVAAARFEVWWRAEKRRLSSYAIAAAFGRDHSTVLGGVARFEEMLAESAELRARMAWADGEQARRSA